MTPCATPSTPDCVEPPSACVRDIMDTANDMLFGIVGATVFVLVYKGTEWYQRKRALPKRARTRRS